MRRRYMDNYATAALPASLTHAATRGVLARAHQRWNADELRYLNRWVGVRLIEVLCRHLQRSERALRCKLHRLGLSAKVREGWGLKALCIYYHLSVRTVLRQVVEGHLRVHCAQVRSFSSLAHGHRDGRTSREAQRWRRWAKDRSLLIGEIGATLHLTTRQICATVLRGHGRLTHLRLSEASVQCWCVDGHVPR